MNELPDGTAKKQQHTPDKSKLPRKLQSLPWMEMRTSRYPDCHDGDTLLVAVPVCNRSDRPDGEWSYELSVVTIRCDEHYFSVEVSTGDDWGWELDDADWLVTL